MEALCHGNNQSAGYSPNPARLLRRSSFNYGHAVKPLPINLGIGHLPR